ncbi:MAG: hypothetical protein EA344_12940 [Alkalicoccus sp.]|nr:MAG: hypothetical protein EA344_12940 [Alkalicoccus sp.]
MADDNHSSNKKEPDIFNEEVYKFINTDAINKDLNTLPGEGVVVSLSLYENSLEKTHFQPEDLEGTLLDQQTVKGIRVSDNIIYIEEPGIKGEKGIFLGMKDRGLTSLDEDQLNSLKNDPDLLSRFGDSDFDDEKKS